MLDGRPAKTTINLSTHDPYRSQGAPEPNSSSCPLTSACLCSPRLLSWARTLTSRTSPCKLILVLLRAPHAHVQSPWREQAAVLVRRR